LFTIGDQRDLVKLPRDQSQVATGQLAVFKARLARNASRSDAGGGDEHIQIDTSGASNAVTITCETVH
jgi:hypothetical protein